MSRATALVAAMAVAFSTVLFLVIFLLDEPAEDCMPTGPRSSGGKTMPMREGTYTLTSGFGPRWGTQHLGQDFGADEGTPIYAAADGVVAEAGPASGFGQWIVLDHNIDGQQVSTVYGHMYDDGVLVHAGETVRAGQEIARVGNNGESTGAHLHFEVWEGGTRLGGGHAIDPMPWLADAGSTETPAPTTPAPDATLAAGAGELPPLPAAKGSEEHLQIDSVRVARAIADQFPQVETIGGWRAADAFPDHPSGRAVDVMIPDYTSGAGKALGDQIADYVLANAETLRVDYIIWRQTYRTPAGESNLMEDRGSDTANHFDHVHITTYGGGYPDGSTPIGPAPATPAPHCAPGVDADLAPGTVPPELDPLYRKAGAICPQISAPLLAAQGKQESGFDPRAVSSVGAQGIAQFMPSTWPAYGRDENGDGTADPFDPEDAIPGQGRYMCAIATQVDTWIAEGQVKLGPAGPEELYLAAYNAGEGAVLSSGGFPTGSPDYEVQTRPYVDTILASARQFSQSLD